MKIAYLVIFLIVFWVSALGSAFTNVGVDTWYDALIKPALIPPDWVFGVAWTVIYILTAWSVCLLWRSKPRNHLWRHLVLLFIFNAALNIYWSQLFFGMGEIKLALIEMIALNLITIITAIMLWWRKLKLASILLLPYILWVTFATYLTWEILLLN